MNYTSSDTVHEASIDLECNTTPTGRPNWWPMRLHEPMWNGSYATWGSTNNNLLWDAGAEGGADRGDWEPPTTIRPTERSPSTSPRIAQSAARSNNAYLSVIVASVGATYSCSMSEDTVAPNRPELTLDVSTGAASSARNRFARPARRRRHALDGSDFLLTP